MSWELFLLAPAAGAAAGVINTLAGSGSAVTLAVLVFLGVPADVANATNRIGVIAQNVVGVGVYRRAGALELEAGGAAIVWCTLGAALGALIAVDLDARTMELAIGAMLLLVLAMVLLRPGSWLRETSEPLGRRRRLALWPVYFAVGVYGGFIQAGVGVFLLAALVLGARRTLVGANGVKLVVVLALNVIAFGIFIYSSLAIAWVIGAGMAAGQMIGAWVAARFATRSERAEVWMRRLLIVVLLVSIPRFFGLYARLFAAL